MLHIKTSTRSDILLTHFTTADDVDPIEAYLAHLRTLNYAPRTIKAYSNELHLVESALGKRLLAATSTDLRRYMEQHAAHAAGTVGKKQSTIRSFFRWAAIRYHLLDPDPCREFRLPRAEFRVREVLQGHHYNALFRALRYDSPFRARDAAGMAVLMQTGMRASEVVALDLEDLDEVQSTVRAFGKRRERVIEVPADFWSHIRPWLDMHPLKRGPLFADPFTGQRLDSDGLRRLVARKTKDAGLQALKLSPHDFRHSYATYMNVHGMPFRDIQRQLGHVNANSTSSYVHGALSPSGVQALNKAFRRRKAA